MHAQTMNIAHGGPLARSWRPTLLVRHPTARRITSVNRHLINTKAAKAQSQTEGVEGPSTDLSVISQRLSKLVLPYWQEVPNARWQLAGVVALTLATTGVSVVFNFLGRDFFNALSEKDVDGFKLQLLKYLAGFVVGIPVFVFKGYYQSRLALDWREWMTQQLMAEYFKDRSFYQLQSAALVDNPDQRICADIRQFTDTALGLALVVLNSVIDLVSFSGILYSIYPPLFAAMLVYSIGGTVGSVYVGRSLVGLNFNQEAREADLRYGLVRVRENAESIAFYGGENSEMKQLMQRLQAVVSNYGSLLVASRNLDFFTSFYRFLIQLLPAAVVAPLYFSGKIEFGVINQSQSAFNHILNDVSVVVYQFEALAGFSAVIDRLGEFEEVVTAKLQHGKLTVEQGSSSSTEPTAADDTSPSEAAAGSVTTPDLAAPSTAAAAAAAAEVQAAGQAAATASPPATPLSSNAELPGLRIVHCPAQGPVLLELEDVCMTTPDGQLSLVQHLDLQVERGQSLLIMGPSGAGKTSVLRALAGLWRSGSGTITSYDLPGLGDPGNQPGSVLFLPQKPYMVLGSLRDQLLYPTWADSSAGSGSSSEGSGASSSSGSESSISGVQGRNDSAATSSSSSGNGAAGVVRAGNGSSSNGSSSSSSSNGISNANRPPRPTDAQLAEVMHQVQLKGLLKRCASAAAALKQAAATSTVTPSTSSSSSSPAADHLGPQSQAAGSSSPGAVLPPSSTSGSPSRPSSSSSAGSSWSSSEEEGQDWGPALDYVADWSAQLSLGEQQRLAFARLLLAAPRLALLDEATSALDTRNEALLYKAVLSAGVTCISVGHRPSLTSFHPRVLLLGASGGGSAGGSWQVRPAAEAAQIISDATAAVSQ